MPARAVGPVLDHDPCRFQLFPDGIALGVILGLPRSRALCQQDFHFVIRESGPGGTVGETEDPVGFLEQEEGIGSLPGGDPLLKDLATQMEEGGQGGTGVEVLRQSRTEALPRSGGPRARLRFPPLPLADFGFQAAAEIDEGPPGLGGALQGVPGEVEGAPVMGPEDEKAEVERLESAGGKVLQRVDVAQGFRHFSSVHLEKACVHPKFDEGPAGGAFALGDFALMVGKNVVLPSRVDVEGLSQVFHGHGRAFDVPSGEAMRAENRVPLHEVAGIGLPESEIRRVPLFGIDLDAGTGLQGIDPVAGKPAVGRKGADVEVDVLPHPVGMPRFQKPPDQSDHLRDVPGGTRIVMGGLDVKGLQIRKKITGDHLHQLPGVHFLAPRLGFELVLAFVGIVDQMPHVGDVHHLDHPETPLFENPPQQIGKEKSPVVPDVGPLIDGRTAVVHFDHTRFQRLEILHAAGEGVVEAKSRSGLSHGVEF